ncbi:MAG TPA: helix-turn-helix transcriptional regulator [Acidimicrobiales bacterium]|nr:helix-turn-helix transcriptional regulator [Acidimicrobiales bacterium]
MLRMVAIQEKRQAKRGLPAPAMRRAIREASGLSQEDIAQAFQPPIHRETVSRWERGERTPRGALLVAYVALLDELRGGTS